MPIFYRGPHESPEESEHQCPNVSSVNIRIAHLNKSNDYRQSNVDASYYALNFPKHRFVVSSKIKIGQIIELRLDAEYRQQEKNTLRKGSSEAFFLAAGLQWKPLTNKNVVFGLNADNITDETFERFPGTPALGRQLSANFSYGW